jgi:hypothetical protein
VQSAYNRAPGALDDLDDATLKPTVTASPFESHRNMIAIESRTRVTGTHQHVLAAFIGDDGSQAAPQSFVTAHRELDPLRRCESATAQLDDKPFRCQSPKHSLKGSVVRRRQTNGRTDIFRHLRMRRVVFEIVQQTRSIDPVRRTFVARLAAPLPARTIAFHQVICAFASQRTRSP